MALVPGNVITVAGSGIIKIPYPQTGGQWTQLKLENATAYGLTVYFDGNPVHSLPAGVADVFPLTYGPANVNSSPVNVPAPQITVQTVSEPASGDLPGTIRPSFGQYGDSFPGVYPLALAAAGVVLVSGVDTTGGVGYTPAGSSIANNTNQLMFAVPPAGTLWEVAYMHVWIAAATTQGAIALEETPGGRVYIALPTVAGTTGALAVGTKFTLNRSVYLVNNNTGAVGNGVVLYRSVPSNYGPI